MNFIGNTRRPWVPRDNLELWLTSHSEVPKLGTWLDRSGNIERSPVLAGDAIVTAETGWIGDGTSDSANLLSATTPYSVKGLSEITMCCWAYITSRSLKSVFLEATSGDYWRFTLILAKTTSNRMDFQYRNTTTGDTGARQIITSSVEFPATAWTHLAAVYSVAAGTATLYQNGASVGSIASGVTAMTNTAPVTARVGAAVGGIYSWPGKIDRFSIHSRALGQSEIQHLIQTTRHI